MITLREASRLTRFSIEALRARCAHGKITGARQDSEGRWLIPEIELEKLSVRLAEPLYTPREVAALLSFSEEYIRLRLRTRDSDPAPVFRRAFKLWGEWRIPESDLIDLMAQEEDPSVDNLRSEAMAAAR